MPSASCAGRADRTWIARATAIAGDLASAIVIVMIVPLVLIVVAAPVVLLVRAILAIAGWL